MTPSEIHRTNIASYSLMGIGLIAVLLLGLLPALLGGLLIYQMVIFGAKKLGDVGVIPATGKIILLVFIALFFIASIVLSSVMVANQIANGPESIVALLQKMADVVDTGRVYLPSWLQSYIPSNVHEWQVKTSEWLRTNALEFSAAGQGAGLFLVHLIVGMIIGGMVALHPAAPSRRAPLAHALSERVTLLGLSFGRIVFSQIRISALNTFLTGIFLAVIMPMMGYDLPLVKTMIAVTFIVGLLPIVGNIISNTVIFLIALSVSFGAAIGALIFLIVIHKLEYFINARIIGTQIRSRAWEILLALLVMDAAFGLPGLIAAPIYYAYMKDELLAKKLV